MGPEPILLAACAECIETTQSAIRGALPTSVVLRRFRAADGRMRVDYGNFSILTFPATGERIILDHIALEARIFLIALALAEGALPSVSAEAEFAAGFIAPTLVGLGAAVLDGLELEGMRLVFEALDPLLPPPIYSWEVWTSPMLQLPVVTTTIGAFGIRTCVCRCVAVDPPEAVFEVPYWYTVTRPVPPL